MSFLEYRIKTAPSGLRKVLFINWPLVLLITAVASVGFLMLYSVAGGEIDRWARLLGGRPAFDRLACRFAEIEFERQRRQQLR